MSLRETVVIRTTTGDLKGELSVGADGLPELDLHEDDLCCHGLTESTVTYHPHQYRPATFPAAWTLLPVGGMAHGPLVQAWVDITDIQSMISDAQRDADAEEQREPVLDSIDEYKRYADARGER